MSNRLSKIESRFKDNQEVQDYISEFINAEGEGKKQERQEMWNRWRLFALRRYRYHLHRFGPIRICINEMDDIIFEAIGDVYIADRHWPRIDKKGKEVSFYALICGVIQSKLFHRFSKNKQTISLDEAQESNNLQLLNEVFQIIGDSIDSVEEAAICAELCTLVLKSIRSDLRLTHIAELIMSGLTSRKDLAIASNLSEREVAALVKRLRFKLRRLREEIRYGT